MDHIKPGRVAHDGGTMMHMYICVIAIRALVEKRFREGNTVVDDAFMTEYQSLCQDQLPVALQSGGEMLDSFLRARREAARLMFEIIESYFKPGAVLDINFLDTFYPYILKRLAEKGLLPQAPSPATGGDP